MLVIMKNRSQSPRNPTSRLVLYISVHSSYSSHSREFDPGAVVQGGMGITAPDNINPQGKSRSESIGKRRSGGHQSLAAICAGQIMLDFLGETEVAAAIENSVVRVVREKVKSLAAEKMGYRTSEIGDLVAGAL
jgi:3-isopropylmalate dehydrogenase